MGIPPELSPDHAELLQISRQNECHGRGDFEPQTRGNQTIAERAEPRYDSEAADENVHLVATASVSSCFPTCQRLIRVPLTRSNSAALRTDDIVSMCARARSIQRSLWSLSLGQRTAERYPGISGFAAQQTGLLGGSWTVGRASQSIQKILDLLAAA